MRLYMQSVYVGSSTTFDVIVEAHVNSYSIIKYSLYCLS